MRDLARIASLDALLRLLALAAGQTARLINVSDLAAPFQLSRPTIKDYVTLLEGVFLVEQLPPWHSNRLSRLVKTPKLHLGDTGASCATPRANVLPRALCCTTARPAWDSEKDSMRCPYAPCGS